MNYRKLNENNPAEIQKMSSLATAIVKEHFDPIIGSAQNDYMIDRFQTPEAIRKALLEGYAYYFVQDRGITVGFLAIKERSDAMYLSKFYLFKSERGKGYANQMLCFAIEQTKSAGLSAIELNVNKNNMAVAVYKSLGFSIIRSEKNDIGSGFYMDDYVFRLEVTE